MRRPRNDPLEEQLAHALEQAGIDFACEDDPRNTKRLDFYLPQHDLYIEVKRMHTERLTDQMSRAENIIAVQGPAAVEWLCAMLVRPRA